MGKRIKAKADTLQDALKQIEAQAEAQTPAFDVKRPQEIGFYYRHENGNYNVYLGGETHEILSGVFDTEADAISACNACNEVNDKRPAPVSAPARRVKVSTPLKLQIQAVALNLDPIRRVRFRETMLAINYLTHMLADAIDENAGLFDAMFSGEAKQRVRILNKQLDAILDAVYSSKVMGEAEDYTFIANTASDLRERFEMFVSYVASEKWRFEALDKAFANLLPDSFINRERAEIAEKMKMDIIGDNKVKERSDKH